MDRISNRYWVFCICLALALATLAVFWQVRHYEFIVTFDDDIYIVDNSHVQAGLTREGLVWAFTTTRGYNWHALTWLSHMLDCEFYGLEPGGHHFTNVLFHIANTLLLLLVLNRMTGSLWSSAFVAAAFALHPLHVESVAWVSERKDVLSTFFWMLTMWAYVCYVERPVVKRHLVVLLLFALGLMAKQMLVTLPFVLLLLDYWPLGRLALKGRSVGNPATASGPVSARRCILEKLPLFILSAVGSVVSYVVESATGTVKSFVECPLVYRAGNALVAYIAYIGKMLWPGHLAIFYPHPRGDLPIWQIIMAALLLVGITTVVIWSARQRPYLAVGWLWYIGTLVPAIGLVQSGLQALADRYTYISLTGLFIIIAWGIPDLLGRLRYRKALLSLSAAVLLSALAVTAWHQVRHWRNDMTLHKHAAEVVRDNWLAYLKLGDVLAAQGKLDEAIKHYTEALRIEPDYPTVRNALGIALSRQGKLDEAVSHYTRALQVNPDLADVHNNLGYALTLQGKLDEAIAHFEETLRIRPDHAKAHNGLGVVLARQGKFDQAIKHYIEALRIGTLEEQKSAAVQSNLAYALYALLHQGNRDEAVMHFRETLRVKPDWVEPMNSLAWLLATETSLRSPKEAVQLAERACELTNYENASLLDTLAAAYAAAGKFAQAIETAEEALESAQSSGQNQLMDEIQNRLRLYKAGQPYIEH